MCLWPEYNKPMLGIINSSSSYKRRTVFTILSAHKRFLRNEVASSSMRLTDEDGTFQLKILASGTIDTHCIRYLYLPVLYSWIPIER